MPSAHTLLAFSLVAMAFIAIPGPSNLYVMARGLQSGSAAAIAGAAYLCWLGLAALRSPAVEAPRATVNGSLGRSYRQGTLVELGNPKVALFFLALLPQFVHSGDGPAALQVLVLGTIFVAIGLVSDSLYALSSGRLSTWLSRRPGRYRRQRRATGVLYLGLGGWAGVSGAK